MALFCSISSTVVDFKGSKRKTRSPLLTFSFNFSMYSSLFKSRTSILEIKDQSFTHLTKDHLR